MAINSTNRKTRLKGGGESRYDSALTVYAEDVLYEPNNPGDWVTIPVNGQEALDALATLAILSSSRDPLRYALLGA